jgi:O-acetyl-ADP-ribose deacetylase (regulator of RNase III)
MPRFLGLLDRLFRRSSRRRFPGPRDEPKTRSAERRWLAGGGLEVQLFVGELTDAPAEALCTSTNPRLSMGGGTGRSVLAETGWGLRRQLEELAEEEARRTGKSELPVGFTCATPGGQPPHRLIVHCVASDALHHATPEAARRCVEGALFEADRAGCTSLALPIFGTGHADLPYDRSLQAMAEALRDAGPSSVQTVLLVLLLPDRAPLARAVLGRVLAPAP